MEPLPQADDAIPHISPSLCRNKRTMPQIPYDIAVPDGGRERSRTSDPYSVKE